MNTDQMLKVKDVIDWLEDTVCTNHAIEKAGELRNIANTLCVVTLPEYVIKSWMMGAFEDGGWGYGAMMYDLAHGHKAY